ncbi:MAG: hypothetical protein WAK01_16210 [Methylocystis sp.]
MNAQRSSRATTAPSAEAAIRILAAVEKHVHPRLLFGTFKGDELATVRSCDGRIWARERYENAAEFEARILRDLVERNRDVSDSNGRT